MQSQESTPRSTVLVALDGSPAAVTALGWARVIARQLGADVGGLHVAAETRPEPDVWERLHRALRPGETLHIRTQPGDPGPAILEAAAEPATELLALTTHGREVMTDGRLGRVATEVIVGATGPILVVRPEAMREKGLLPHPVRRLLVPLDGTPTTAAALAPAVALSRRLGAAIDLLYVAGDRGGRPVERGSICAPQYVNQAHYEWPAWASDVRDWFYSCCGQGPAALSVQAFCAHGEVGPTITQFAREHGEDAVALVRRSHLEPGRAPALRAVLEQTYCPVLLLPGPSVDLDLVHLRTATASAGSGAAEPVSTRGRDQEAGRRASWPRPA
jgi:nucleotide-binding universal stress UspA family protein